MASSSSSRTSSKIEIEVRHFPAASGPPGEERSRLGRAAREAKLRLDLPPAPRPSRSLSPALKRGGGGGGGSGASTPVTDGTDRRYHPLPTRAPTPPRSSLDVCSPRTPPSSPMTSRRKSPAPHPRQRETPAVELHVSSCPSTPLMQRTNRLEVPSRKVFANTAAASGREPAIVVPRRASALSRSPSPNPSRTPIINVDGETSGSLADEAKSHSSGGMRGRVLNNLSPMVGRKYGTASMASYDRSDGMYAGATARTPSPDSCQRGNASPSPRPFSDSHWSSPRKDETSRGAAAGASSSAFTADRGKAKTAEPTERFFAIQRTANV
jgi:hypothetical protein